jgi:Tol biopolymer transport system component
LEIFFASDVEGVSEIWTSTRASAADPWAPAVRVAELSSAEDDIDPDVSPDGSTLYLSSNRGALGYQLFVSRRIGRSEPWSTPEAVVGIPTTHYNLAPSVDPAGLLMVFAMQTAGPDQIFLYSAARSTTSDAWGAVEPLTSIASAYQDQKPALFDNGRGLVFSSRRTDQGRTSDLFVTTRADRTKPWGAPSAIPALDTDSWEGDPWVSQDGGHILFVSNRNDGVSRIYEAWR